tara:strand:- start:4001 stop:5107 length:1107 start_codon:yes stop_codon:yes gene_type:complete
MAGFQSLNRNRRINNLALFKELPGVSAPAPTVAPVSGNTYRATFTSPGTFTLKSTSTYNPSKVRTISPINPGGTVNAFEMLAVAGGGGGCFGGGGGAGGGGGVVYDPSFSLDNGKSGEFTVSIGSGGPGQTSPSGPEPGSGYPLPGTGAPGGDTEVYYTPDGPLPNSGGAWGVYARGGGGAVGSYANVGNKPGGSGGGAGYGPQVTSDPQRSAGIQPSITQGSSNAVNHGYPGGRGTNPGYSHSGGGGGAGGAGSNGGGPAGPGGSGYTSSISGSPYPYSAGGGGGTGGRWTGPGGSWNGGYGTAGSPLAGRGGGCPPSGPPSSQTEGYAANGYGAGGAPGGNFIHVGPSRKGWDGYQGIVIVKYTTA